MTPREPLWLRAYDAGVRRILLGAAICTAAAVAAVLGSVSQAWAASVTIAPVTGPQRAPVSLLVRCVPDAASLAVQLRPASESAPTTYDPSKDLFPPIAHDGREPGVFVVDTEIPLETPDGSVTFDVFCLDASNALVDGPASASFEVARLPLQITPDEGGPGTRVTVTGGGCPAGSTIVFVRVGGAEDQIAPFDPEQPGQFTAPVATDGTFTVSFQMPRDLASGEISVQSFCATEPAEGPPVPTAGPGFAVFVLAELPPSGASPAALVMAGTGLMLVGLAMQRLATGRAITR